MARRAPVQPPTPAELASSEKAKHAFESVVESIHDDHKMLEGEELWKAVVEIFGITRARAVTKESK